MKIRTLLVSNSSSSSFVCLMKKDAFEKAYKESHPYTQAVVDATFGTTTVFGLELMETSNASGMDGCDMFDWLDLEYEGEPEEGKYGDISSHEAWSSFIGRVPKEDKWTHREDW